MSASSAGRWLVYALGGGWGHLTRAAALARVAGVRARILTNCAYAGAVRARMPELDIVALGPELPLQKAREEVLDQIERAEASSLIVDTFPRGLGGELTALLPGLRVPRVLIHRDLNPDYVRAKKLSAFVQANFDLVIQPGGAERGEFAGLAQAISTAPWLIRSVEELRTRVDARRLLGAEERHCVLVLAAGNREELAWYGRVARSLIEALKGVEVRLIAPACPPECPERIWRSYWPAMDLLPGADVVVGGGGYNTVNECAACGVPLLARPWARTYDRQSRRSSAQAETCPAEIDQVLAAVEARLKRPLRTGEIRDFPNGAREAAELIRRVTARTLS